MLLQKTVNKSEYYKQILATLYFFKFTEFELDILSAMLDNDMTVVNIDSREVIRKVLNKDKFIINNYIKRLKNRNVFLEIPNTKALNINPIIIDLIREGQITYNFNMSGN